MWNGIGIGITNHGWHWKQVKDKWSDHCTTATAFATATSMIRTMMSAPKLERRHLPRYQSFHPAPILAFWQETESIEVDARPSWIPRAPSTWVIQVSAPELSHPCSMKTCINMNDPQKEGTSRNASTHVACHGLWLQGCNRDTLDTKHWAWWSASWRSSVLRTDVHEPILPWSQTKSVHPHGNSISQSVRNSPPLSLKSLISHNLPCTPFWKTLTGCLLLVCFHVWFGQDSLWMGPHCKVQLSRIRSFTHDGQVSEVEKA